MAISAQDARSFHRFVFPDLPLVVWMALATIVLLLIGGAGAADAIADYNEGFGRSIGEFALILLPSFTLAAALGRMRFAGAPGAAGAAAPFAGAGMVCPDTAYAALSPIAGRARPAVALSSYAGFKLLFPAGPLMVATGMGVQSDALIWIGAALLIPVWAAGVLWARAWGGAATEQASDDAALRGGGAALAAKPFAPLLLLGALVTLGVAVEPPANGPLAFMITPKGALIAAAALSLALIPRAERRACLDSGVSRTAGLLLLIGAATAFGQALTAIAPLDALAAAGDGLIGLFGLFALAAAFKLVQGSSMATFAAVAPVAAPFVAQTGLAPEAAVFAVCLGSFIAILPNDSFYWLVRRDAFAEQSEGASLFFLGVGAALQAAVGLVLLIAMVEFGLV